MDLNSVPHACRVTFLTAAPPSPLLSYFCLALLHYTTIRGIQMSRTEICWPFSRGIAWLKARNHFGASVTINVLLHPYHSWWTCFRWYILVRFHRDLICMANTQVSYETWLLKSGCRQMLYLYFWVETPKPFKGCLLDKGDHRVSQNWWVLVSGLTHGFFSEETSCGPRAAIPLLWKHQNLEVSIVLNSVAPMAALMLHSQYNLSSKKILFPEAIEKLRMKMSPCGTCFRSKRLIFRQMS